MAERAGLGAGRRQVVVPAQSGRAVSVSCGDLVRVVDIEGHQVWDMWAVDAADHGRWLSVSHTRDRCERLFPAVGGQFCDQRGTPVLELAGDTSPGVHDMLFPPCDRWLYESRGLAGHPNCRDNFLAAAASARIVLLVVPDPVNLLPAIRWHASYRRGRLIARRRNCLHRPAGPRRHPDRMLGRLPAPEPEPLQPATDRDQPRRCPVIPAARHAGAAASAGTRPPRARSLATVSGRRRADQPLSSAD
jgi:Domain of unknown function (DUF1989)